MKIKKLCHCSSSRDKENYDRRRKLSVRTMNSNVTITKLSNHDFLVSANKVVSLFPIGNGFTPPFGHGLIRSICLAYGRMVCQVGENHSLAGPKKSHQGYIQSKILVTFDQIKNLTKAFSIFGIKEIKEKTPWYIDSDFAILESKNEASSFLNCDSGIDLLTPKGATIGPILITRFAWALVSDDSRNYLMTR